MSYDFDVARFSLQILELLHSLSKIKYAAEQDICLVDVLVAIFVCARR